MTVNPVDMISRGWQTFSMGAKELVFLARQAIWSLVAQKQPYIIHRLIVWLGSNENFILGH